MNTLIFRTHALKRMAERSISKDDIVSALENGRAIMYYNDDKPLASKMILGYSDKRPLHVLIAEDTAAAATIVITVYEPDADRWNESYDERIKK